MIYDCFSFYNELDLLEIWLNVLWDVVDKFVLTEATLTHTGKPKPLYFNENRTEFAALIHDPPDCYHDRTRRERRRQARKEGR